MDQNSHLSNIEKLSYLNSKLTGEAKQAVSGIYLSNDNYDITKTQRTAETTIGIMLKGGSVMNIRASVVPSITGSILRRPVQCKYLQNWEHLWNEETLACQCYQILYILECGCQKSPSDSYLSSTTAVHLVQLMAHPMLFSYSTLTVRVFPCNVTGLNRPNGSYTEANRFKASLFVKPEFALLSLCPFKHMVSFFQFSSSLLANHP